MCTFGGVNAFAWVAADGLIWVRYTNAPEGTVFVDILLKKTDDDKYASADGKLSASLIIYGEDENGERTENPLILDENCGLAKYDDGYTSCLFGRNIATEYRIHSSDVDIILDEQKLKNIDVSNYYGSFKVAYCDEKGNVLGVTELIELEKTDKPANFYVNADGSSLEYDLDHGIDVGKGLSFIFLACFALLIVIIPGIVVVIVIIVVLLLVMRHNKEKKQVRQ